MKRILWLFLFALPLAAQVNNPSVRYVGSAPTGSCSQAPPVQVLNSSGAIYTCNNGTWAVQGGGGSGTVGAGTAGQYARYLANGTTVAGESGTSILVTDPPYNAKCDGSSDDSVAIQAAINSGFVVNFPQNSAGSYIQCNFGSPLTVPFYTVVNGNNIALFYTATSGIGMLFKGINVVSSIQMIIGATTGNVTAAEFDNQQNVYNFNVYVNSTPPTTYLPIKLVNPTGYFNNVVVDGLAVIFYDGSVSELPLTLDSWVVGNSSTTSPSWQVLKIENPPTAPITINSLFSDMRASSGVATDCQICVTSSVAGYSGNLFLNGVDGKYSSGFTGHALFVDTSGSGATAVLSGNFFDTAIPAGHLFTGTWGGVLNFDGVVYRGSAATLTYRCNGGTQAGLIYTNNSSCTGGTAVATGDSVQ